MHSRDTKPEKKHFGHIDTLIQRYKWITYSTKISTCSDCPAVQAITIMNALSGYVHNCD